MRLINGLVCNLLFLLFLSRAEIDRYANEKVSNNNYRDQGHSIYQQLDGPNGMGDSMITYDLEVLIKDPGNLSSFFAVGKIKDTASSPFVSNFRSYCSNGISAERDENLIMELKFDKAGISFVKGSRRVNETGIHSSFFLSCYSQLYANGQVEFKNSFGQLSGENYYTIRPINYAIVLYSLLVGAWAFAIFKHRKRTNAQFYLMIIIFSTFIECIIHRICMQVFNATGETRFFLFFALRILYCLRITCTKILVFLICCAFHVLDFDSVSEKYRNNTSSNSTLLKLWSFVYFMANLVFLSIQYHTTQSHNFIDISVYCRVVNDVLEYTLYLWSISQLYGIFSLVWSMENTVRALYFVFCVFLALVTSFKAFLNLTFLVYQIARIFMPAIWRYHFIIYIGYDLLIHTVFVIIAAFLWRPRIKPLGFRIIKNSVYKSSFQDESDPSSSDDDSVEDDSEMDSKMGQLSLDEEKYVQNDSIILSDPIIAPIKL